jgi:ferredoxin-nitrite reductase
MSSLENGAASATVENASTNGAPASGAAKTGFDPKSRHAKLKLTDDGRLATLKELGDERATLTKNERLKLEKPGPAVWKDIIERYASQGFDSIEEDDFERFKWIGFYQQRPKDGHFMLRLKVPGGRLTNDQLRMFAGIVHDYARGVADITTRQTFQVHWLTIDQAPDIMERMGKVGLGVLAGLFGPCGDICRNIVSSPLAGIDPEEVIDVRALVDEASTYFSSHPDFADMPRKYKVGIFGHRSAGQCEVNCTSIYGVKRADGEVGYGVTVGGGLSTEPHLAQDLGVFVKPEQAMQVLEGINAIFRDYGYRKSRKHARFKYLIADWGVEKTRTVLEDEYLGYKLPDAEPIGDFSGYEDKLGIYPQKDGKFFVGVPVVTGRVTADQLDAIADIAQEYGDGEIRLTVMQSFYIPNVAEENTQAVASRLAAIGLPLDVSGIQRGVVACTGIEFCNLAVVETKARAKNIVNLLDEGVKWNNSEFFRINVNGCPNSCGQHWIADVGLQGCTKKIDGQLVEHFDFFLGGGLGSNANYNKRVKRLPAEEVAPAIQKLINVYETGKQNGESFKDFINRQSEEELEALF